MINCVLSIWQLSPKNSIYFKKSQKTSDTIPADVEKLAQYWMVLIGDVGGIRDAMLPLTRDAEHQNNQMFDYIWQPIKKSNANNPKKKSGSIAKTVPASMLRHSFIWLKHVNNSEGWEKNTQYVHNAVWKTSFALLQKYIIYAIHI